MVNRKWTFSEEEILIENYTDCTIKELLRLLPRRKEDAINAKIKRLKKSGRIRTSKKPTAIKRAYLQRNLC